MEFDKKKIVLVPVGIFLAVAILLIYAYASHKIWFWGGKNNGADSEASQNMQLNTEVLQKGYESNLVKPGDLVSVNYIGALQDGSIFDSNLSKGVPYEVFIGKGEAPKGWDEGLIGMTVGEKRKLTVPPSLAYGSEGYGSIPPNATITYEVELLAIK